MLGAFIHGVREFRSHWTTPYDGSELDAYDRGRELMHRITRRKYDQ